MSTVNDPPHFYDKHGVLDTQWFDQVSASQLRNWFNLYFFANKYNDSPSNSIIRLLDELEPHGHLKGRITLAIAEILKGYPRTLLGLDESATTVQHYGLIELFRVCVSRKLPQANSWFLQQLQDISNESAAMWVNLNLAKPLLMATTMQVPAASGEVAHQHWRALLVNPTYTTVALMGFGESFGERISRLDTWWTVCPTDIRNSKLAGIVNSGIRELGVRGAKKCIVVNGADWESDLKKAVNCVFNEKSLNPPFILKIALDDLLPEEIAELGLQNAVKGIENRINDPFNPFDVKKIVTEGLVHLIHSEEYPGSDVLKNFSNRLREYVEEWLSKNNVAFKLAPSEHFEEATGEITTEKHKVIFSFPFLLPYNKSNEERMSVLHYGWHNQFGILIPKDNPYLTPRWKQGSSHNFVDVMSALLGSRRGTIYGLRNYSILDVVREGVGSDPALAGLTVRDDQIVGLGSAVGQYLPASLMSLDRNDWAFAFDLGDRHRVDAQLNEWNFQDNFHVWNVAHNLRIPVGVGISIYAAPVILKYDWRQLHAEIIRCISEKVEFEFNKIGIMIDRNLQLPSSDSVIDISSTSSQ